MYFLFIISQSFAEFFDVKLSLGSRVMALRNFFSTSWSMLYFIFSSIWVMILSLNSLKWSMTWSKELSILYLIDMVSTIFELICWKVKSRSALGHSPCYYLHLHFLIPHKNILLWEQFLLKQYSKASFPEVHFTISSFDVCSNNSKG